MENEAFENIKFNDLNKTVYDNCIFKCSDFSNINIEDIGFINCKFIECKFVGTAINDSLLKNVLFDSCKMDFIIISDSNINNVCFNKCTLIEGTLYNNKLNKKSYIFNNNNMEKININDSMKNISLIDNNINGININLENIKGCVISKDDLIILSGLLGVEVK